MTAVQRWMQSKYGVTLPTIAPQFITYLWCRRSIAFYLWHTSAEHQQLILKKITPQPLEGVIKGTWLDPHICGPRL